MSRKNKIILALSLVVICLICLITNKSYNSNQYNNYNIAAELNLKNKTINAVQNLTYLNKTGHALNEVYLHIYPNAFKNHNTAPFLANEANRAYPNGFSPGSIDILSVENNNKVMQYDVEGKDRTILHVKLSSILKNDDRMILSISFRVYLPNSEGRFGYGNNTINITNWYPIACVYDDNGWHKDPYYTLGDPFYSDVSNYNVVIKLPIDYTVASSGYQYKNDIKGNYREIYIKANKVRDFAMVLSNKFKILSEKVGGITIKTYYFADNEIGRKSLNYAVDALNFYINYIGEYPYKEYNVVEADFYIGGMEYPNLVMIDKNLYTKSNIFNLEYVIAHETAHQWWYGLVGNDEVNEAWLDEGLTEYTTLMYMESMYGKKAANNLYEKAIVGPYLSFEKTAKNDNSLKSLGEFTNWNDYTNLVYNKGAMIYGDLRELTGDEVFKNILREYYKEFKYKNATTQDIIDVSSKVYGKNLGGFFQEKLY